MTTAMPHHHDDVLSAVLDGEADSPEADHVAGCEACARRVDQLRAAAVAIADLPPPDPAERDVRVRTAIQRGAARLVRGGAATDDAAASHRRSGPPVWAVAAASVVALVAVAAGATTLLSGGDDADQLARAEQEALAEAGPDAGFLGAFDEDRVLADELTTQMGVGATPQADGSGEGGFFAPGSDAMVDDSEAGGGSAEPLAGASRPRPAAERLDDAEVAACAKAQRAEFTGDGEPLLVARLTWKGEPAAVFVHRLDSGDPGAFGAWVYAGEPCSLRTFLRF